MAPRYHTPSILDELRDFEDLMASVGIFRGQSRKKTGGYEYHPCPVHRESKGQSFWANYQIARWGCKGACDMAGGDGHLPPADGPGQGCHALRDAHADP